MRFLATVTLVGSALALACASKTGPAPELARDAAPPVAAPFEVDVYNFSGERCEYLVGARGQTPRGEPASLERDHQRITLGAGEALFVREAGGEHFGVSAWFDAEGGAIVVTEACRSVTTADDGFDDAALAALRPHELVACCSSCEGATCSSCTVPEGEVECTAQQVVPARCTLWQDILDCAPADVASER